MEINTFPYTVGGVEFLAFTTQEDIEIAHRLKVTEQRFEELMNMTLLELDQVLRNEVRESVRKGNKEYLDLKNKVGA